MESLNLSVPAQHDYTDPTVELDPARLQVWLSDLPLMNVVETVRLVSGALAALNEQKLAPEERFRCLEAYRPTVLRLFETVDPLHIRQLSMTRAKRQETTATAAGLFEAFVVQGEPFDGSKYLLSWADNLKELKAICFCGSKATMVIRLDEDVLRIDMREAMLEGLCATRRY